MLKKSRFKSITRLPSQFLRTDLKKIKKELDGRESFYFGTWPCSVSVELQPDALLARFKCLKIDPVTDLIFLFFFTIS